MVLLALARLRELGDVQFCNPQVNGLRAIVQTDGFGYLGNTGSGGLGHKRDLLQRGPRASLMRRCFSPSERRMNSCLSLFRAG